jgi:LPS-assembly lipoprotein
LSPKVKIFAALLIAAGLGGCGFTPLYGGNGGDAVAPQMSQVEIGNIPERPGQMLRDTLQDDFYRQGAPVAQMYKLTVSYSIGQQGVGIQQDTSSTRTRFIATANWTLAPIGNPKAALTQGQASTEDAENVIDNQYFASELETDTVNQQLADQIAAQITTQVAVYFKTHPQG